MKDVGQNPVALGRAGAGQGNRHAGQHAPHTPAKTGRYWPAGPLTHVAFPETPGLTSSSSDASGMTCDDSCYWCHGNEAGLIKPLPVRMIADIENV
jgi:hypothetical protein